MPMFVKKLVLPIIAILVAGMIAFLVVISTANARDDGKFSDSPWKPWFDKLASGKGLCCSFADGVMVKDVDWDMQGDHYRVRLNGKWVVVPDAAVVTTPNLYKRAVVWPYTDEGGRQQFAVSCQEQVCDDESTLSGTATRTSFQPLSRVLA